MRPADEARQYDDVTSARACLQCIVPYIRNLSLFRNVCLQAGIIDVVDPNIGWTVRNRALVDVVKTLADRPILIFQSLKIVANEEDKQRRPDGEAFRRLINGHREHFKVKLGHSQFVQDDADLACDLDLFDKLTVTDAIDLVKIADVVCSGAVIPDNPRASLLHESRMPVFSAWAALKHQKRCGYNARTVVPQQA